VLYDVSSTYFESHCCRLARYGHSRDERRGNPQTVFGVLADARGCPVAVEMFAGNTADPTTVAALIAKLRERFALKQVVLVRGSGMLTQARIEQELLPVAGLEWITALRAGQIHKLVADGALQLSLFGQTDLAEITHPDYPGERMVVCRNPLLAQERARKREELMAAADQKLEAIAAATRRAQRPVRDPERIARDAALDGIYVLRTSLPARQLDAAQAVHSYKRLAWLERAFRILKSIEVEIRPIHHRLLDRVRAHVLICLLAYYVEWHLRRVLAPLLFDDELRGGAHPASPVAPAQRSAGALRKARTKRTAAGLPVQSFRDLLRNLATITKIRFSPSSNPSRPSTCSPGPPPCNARPLNWSGLSSELHL
jgi:transposase